MTITRKHFEAVAAVAAAVGGAGAGAFVSARCLPATWSPSVRQSAAGAAAMAAALAADWLVDQVFAPARRRRVHARIAAEQPVLPVAEDREAALAQVAEACAADTGARAAFESWRLDHADGFVRDPRRWRGFPDGDAVCILAPGLALHYRPGHPQPEFTLLSAATTPREVPVDSLREIRDRLADGINADLAA